MPDIHQIDQHLNTILNEISPIATLRASLDGLAIILSEIGGIHPDQSFDGWRYDTSLGDGVAINPEAAAFCIKDYRRSVQFIRGVYAALRSLQTRFPDETVNVLYAGCGPYALLLLPLLHRLELQQGYRIHFLDVHKASLDSVERIAKYLLLPESQLQYIQADACLYQHGKILHLIIAETMQKALEQEPQFAVTANLAGQLHAAGIFIPEKIEVELSLAKLQLETMAGNSTRHSLGRILNLTPAAAARLMNSACIEPVTSLEEISLGDIVIPELENLNAFDVVFFTRITVFENHRLTDYDSEITLPCKYHDLTSLQAGDRYRVSYQLGTYPRFMLHSR